MTDTAQIAAPGAGFVQFPSSARPRERGGLVALLAALAVAAPPWGVAVAASGWAGSLVVAVAGTLAGAALRRPLLARIGWVGRLGAALAVVVVAGVAAGRPVALVMAASIAVTRLAVGRPPQESGSALVHRLRPVVGVSALAAVVGLRSSAVLPVLLVEVVAGAVAALAIHRPSVVRRLERAVDRVVAVLLDVLRSALFVVVGCVVVLIPWAVQRVLRWDPTWSPHRDGTRLVPRAREELAPRRQWGPGATSLRTPIGRRLHRVAMLASVVVVALAVLVAVPAVRSARADRGVERNTAMDGAPWWRGASEAQQATYNFARISAFLGPVLADVRTEHTNVSGGRRATWTPPAPPVLRVWFFGGSAGFGVGQRDDHTIPSQIAQAAWRDGLAVEVTNFAVHGDVHWMEWNRLRAALAAGEAPPDLVVFYDGYNELGTVDYVNDDGRAVGIPMLGSMDSTVLQRRELPERALLRMWSSLGDNGLVDAGPPERLDDDDVVDVAVQQYSVSTHDSAVLLQELGIPAAYFYQPSRVSRSNPVEGEAADEGADWRRMEAEFRARLPAVVVDLSSAMDAERRPVYWDAVHTNELGARIVADDIYSSISTRLSELAGAR